ncbi:unnamed protein product [Lupinus luteus]|uniref:Homeobox domain-containing protein n=1 Tax=Lupinus luteus TaxID=3873 RepID=A0AAV1YB32_LUPLU
MEGDEECITGLCLGLGIGGYVPKKDEKQRVKNSVELAFELCPKGEANNVSHDNSKDRNRSTKKLRLTKEQSAMLESTFKLHSTLNPAQKQALADQLKLKARQIEVWFQNRRARTKLKQTEVDCELLKKKCQNLSDENKRLKKELHELRALEVGSSPLYIQLSKAATLTMCSSCQELFKHNEGT